MYRNEARKHLAKENFTNYNFFEYKQDFPTELTVKQEGNRFFVYETDHLAVKIPESVRICRTEEDAIEEFFERLYEKNNKEIPPWLV